MHTFYFSDDRSPDIFKQKIEAATQMQSVLTTDKRPNCLVIDEIDGAPTVSVCVCVCGGGGGVRGVRGDGHYRQETKLPRH